VIYRSRQLWRALAGRVSAEERALVARLLPAAELELFLRMPGYDQRHCLDVYWTLVRAGHADPLLLRAALFHDTGKVDERGRPLPLLWYGLLVVWKRLWPGGYERIAASPGGLRRYFYYYAHHAALGAELARKAGSPPEIVQALRHYHDDDPSGMAATLQWADLRN
jgi:hypothetical protein